MKLIVNMPNVAKFDVSKTKEVWTWLNEHVGPADNVDDTSPILGGLATTGKGWAIISYSGQTFIEDDKLLTMFILKFSTNNR